MKITFDVDIHDDYFEINGKKQTIKGCSYPWSCLSHSLNSYLFNTFLHFLDGIFNKEVFWCDEVEYAVQYTLNKKYTVYPTRHYFQRISELHLPHNCYKAMLYGEVIEAEFELGNVIKIVTRLQNNKFPDKDICAAISLNADGTAVVRTVWVNRHNDEHSTIHKENYVQHL
ncbi:MAG TPA: hypothetical protein DCW90_10335 [Lachnospiraceae bacterium]|nr:hypothetical protein [Lachnospiraceae bacterium]